MFNISLVLILILRSTINDILSKFHSLTKVLSIFIYIVSSKIIKWFHLFQITLKILKLLSFVINITNQLGLLFFNFNKIVSDIDSKTPASWDCQNSNYLYPPAGHVITGNLNVIPDARVRSIISKGPKYRFPSNIDFSKCRREIAASLNDFSNRWCKQENVEPDALKEWKINIFKIIDTRISFYSRNTHLLSSKPKSSFHHLKRGIQDFNMNFILVLADKAANNVVVVLRLYYINTLKRELVDTNAYKLQPSLSERVIVDGHGCHTALHFGVKAKENQDKVPTLYWLPKLHKNPYKARFIANSSSCTTTELSKLLTSCLTAVKNMLSSIVKILLTVPRWYFFCGSFLFLFCLVFAMSLCTSVYMCFVVTRWERADLLALVCGV